MMGDGAENTFKRRGQIYRLLVWFSRYILSRDVNVDSHSEIFGGRETGEMGIKEWSYPFDV